MLGAQLKRSQPANFAAMPAGAAGAAAIAAAQVSDKPLITMRFYSFARWPDDCRPNGGYPET
jgi:hypothetical protein